MLTFILSQMSETKPQWSPCGGANQPSSRHQLIQYCKTSHSRGAVESRGVPVYSCQHTVKFCWGHSNTV